MPSKEEININSTVDNATSETIPLELAPEDIVIGEFLGEGVYSEVYKGFNSDF